MLGEECQSCVKGKGDWDATGEWVLVWKGEGEERVESKFLKGMK